MEINKFIFFLIIILLSILIFKCSKIYNIREVEKFSFKGQKGFDDTSGYKTSLIDNLLPNTTYLRCNGEWGSCSNDNGNAPCEKTYNIITDNYIGEPCPHESGDTLQCIPDLCDNEDTYIYTETSTDSNTGFDNTIQTEYEITRNSTIIHTRGGVSQGDFQEYHPQDDELWGEDVDTINPNIQLQRLEKVIQYFNNNPDFIGVIKRNDSTGPKFFPIIIDDYSEIEISSDSDSSDTLYMKKNRDCRGTWTPCYESTTTDNIQEGSVQEDSSIEVIQRHYNMNVSATGDGTCAHEDGDTEICAYWGECRDDLGGVQGNNYESNWIIPNPDICQNGENSPCYIYNPETARRSDHCDQNP